MKKLNWFDKNDLIIMLFDKRALTKKMWWNGFDKNKLWQNELPTKPGSEDTHRSKITFELSKVHWVPCNPS